ncbi:MAG: EmrB/QacA family drug resistance transporter, partial [Verrucomicrobiota bacterium]
QSITGILTARGGNEAAVATQAIGSVAQIIHREASVMAFGDCFLILGTVLMAMIPLVWFTNAAKGAGAPSH